MITRVTVTFIDKYGVSGILRFHVPASVVDPADPTITAIVAAANALTRSVGWKIELSVVDTFAGTAGTEAYKAADKALVVCKDDGDDNHLFRIPAPKGGALTTIFLTDNVTLDLADANVVALSAAIAAGALSASGGPLTPIREGHRTWGNRLKN